MLLVDYKALLKRLNPVCTKALEEVPASPSASGTTRSAWSTCC